MRSKPAGGDERLEDALAALRSALDATTVPWMIIGGIAVIARGVRRMTTDIDATIRGDLAKVRSVLGSLAKEQILPRIVDVERFAAQSLVLLLKHQPTGVEFDISLAWTDFENEAIASSSLAAFGSVQAPMAQPEDLIVFKAVAGRPKDIEDATALLVLYPSLDRDRMRTRVRQLASLAEEPDLGAGLETAVAMSAKQSSPRGEASKPRRAKSMVKERPRRTTETKRKKTK